jgi:hypothetical protein
MALARHQFTVVDASGDIVPGASVEVRSEVSGLLVQLYSDRAGTTPIGNPFTADSNGFAFFYVAGGSYKIEASAGSSSLAPWRHVGIGLLGERDALTGVDIEFDPAATGLSAVTVQAALAELDAAVRDRAVAHIFDWIPAAMHADIQARTSVDDVSSYFSDAFADVGLDRRIYAPYGTYIFEAGAPNITAPSSAFSTGLYLFGDGPGKTIFDNRAGVTNHTDTFSTTNGSAIVTVARTAHGYASFDGQLTIHGASASVGGLSFNGTWMIESIPDADHFTFKHTSAASSTASGSVSYGVTNPLLDIDTTHINKFQQFVHLSDFSIENSTSPTASVGIRMRRVYQAMLERLWIKGMQHNGIHITVPNSTAGDRDGGNMVTLRHLRIENCKKWGIECELRSANTGANEFSFFKTDQVFVSGCGTRAVASPPASGGIKWKGQVWQGRDTCCVINSNVGIYVEGAGGLANTLSHDGTVVENNQGRSIFITGLQQGEFNNLQIYNNDGAKACTISNASPAVVTVANDFVADRPIRFATNGTLNSPLVPGTIYYVRATGLSGSSCQISATPGGAAINTTTNGSGSHTISYDVATAGIELDAANFTISNIRARGVVMRATEGNNPYAAFKASGANLQAETCRVDLRDVAWQNFDHAGQTRWSGWSVDHASFSAHKNVTNQTGVTGGGATPVKITFPTEVWDDGGFYDATNSRWTPPPGKVKITTAVYVLGTNVVDQAQTILSVYKNGALLRNVQIMNSSGTGAFQLNGSCLDVANGTDYYEVYINAGGAGDKTVSGAIAYTFFQGEMLA